MEKSVRSRRNFLRTLIFVLGPLLFFWQYLSPRVVSQKVLLEIPLAELPPDGALVYSRSRIAVVRGSDEIYALDLGCTHLGCTVTVTPTEWVCPCHGSRFDRQGAVLQGPASSPLRRLTVKQQDETLVVMA